VQDYDERWPSEPWWGYKRVIMPYLKINPITGNCDNSARAPYFWRQGNEVP